MNRAKHFEIEENLFVFNTVIKEKKYSKEQALLLIETIKQNINIRIK